MRFNFSGVHDLNCYLGVIKVGSKGGQATPLSTEAEGVRFNFRGVHDLDGEGNVYFTDSSIHYYREGLCCLSSLCFALFYC